MNLARRAHQSPGRLVDEDGQRGLPLAQRTGQGQSGVARVTSSSCCRCSETGVGMPTRDGLQHTAVRANRGVFSSYRGHRTGPQLLCPQHALAAAGAAPMEDNQYRSLHTWPVTAKVESNTHEQP